MISVIVVTRNREKKLKKCLLSVEKNALSPQEIIIVDASDNWKKIKKLVLSFKDRLPKTKLIYKKVKHRNVAYSRNQGVKLAKGEILVFLDDDVVLSKNWLKNVLETFQKYPKAVAIAGKILNLYPQNYWAKICHLYATSHERNRKTISFHQYLPSTAIAFRKKVFEDFSWNESFTSAEDIDLTWKLHKNGYQLILNKEIIAYHAFRTSLLSFIKEQFWLGRGFYQLIQNNHDFPYLKKKLLFGGGKPFKLFLFMLFNLKGSLIYLRKRNQWKLLYLPGVLIKESAFSLGTLFQILKNLN